MIPMSVLASPGGVAALPVPLQPAAGVGERAFVLGEAGRRQLEHLGLDLGGIDVVELAVVLPEPRRLGLSGSMTTRNFSFDSAAVIFALLGNDSSGLKPWQM